MYPVVRYYPTLQYLESEQKHDASYSPGTRSEPSPNVGNVTVVRIGNVLKFAPRDTYLTPGGWDWWDVTLLKPRSAQVDLAFYANKT